MKESSGPLPSVINSWGTSRENKLVEEGNATSETADALVVQHGPEFQKLERTDFVACPAEGCALRAYDGVYTRLNDPVCSPNVSVSTPSLCRIVTKSLAKGSSSTSVLLCHPASVSMPAPA